MLKLWSLFYPLLAWNSLPGRSCTCRSERSRAWLGLVRPSEICLLEWALNEPFGTPASGFTAFAKSGSALQRRRRLKAQNPARAC